MFSLVGLTVYAAWASYGLSLVILAYFTDTALEAAIFKASLHILIGCIFVTGLHFASNAQLFNFISSVNRAKSADYDSDSFLKNATGAGGFTLFGIALMLLAIFLSSCAVLKFPYSLYELALMMKDK